MQVSTILLLGGLNFFHLRYFFFRAKLFRVTYVYIFHEQIFFFSFFFMTTGKLFWQQSKKKKKMFRIEYFDI